MEQIHKYYKLCGVYSPKDQPHPLINQIDRKVVTTVFTKKQVELYIKTMDNDSEQITIREKVIGGKRSGKKKSYPVATMVV